MSGGDNQRGRLLGAAAASEAVELGKTVEGAGLGQLLGEVMLEHERLDREGGRPLFLAVAKDGSAFSATPCSDSDGEGLRQIDTETQARGRTRRN